MTRDEARDVVRRASAALAGKRGFSTMSEREPDWKRAWAETTKLLHEALDVIDAINSECILPPQLQDMVDAALAGRQDEKNALTTPQEAEQ